MSEDSRSLSSSLEDPDGFYQALVDLHEGLDAQQSLKLYARLILLMAERIGDDTVLRELLATAAAKQPRA